MDIQCHENMKETVYKMVHDHVDAVVHHVVSLSAIVAMLHGKKKIELKHLRDVRTYVLSKCGGHIKGGMSMPSDFYGYPHQAYASSNINAGVQVSDIQWNKQEARPAQGPAQSGGGARNEYVKELQKLVKIHVSTLNANISKGAVEELVKIVDAHLRCFAEDLAKESPLTVKKVEKILGKRRHKAFE